ncbi:hypothetical protein MNBD_ALPHA12-1918 [hydrothermal vent metagenome]|uniref:Uncharacterized protein n=1 Tax=hydrothermal vent metagenome TaxID=652676 RepID=A0A3B0U6H2_9ZZZZ
MPRGAYRICHDALKPRCSKSCPCGGAPGYRRLALRSLRLRLISFPNSTFFCHSGAGLNPFLFMLCCKKNRWTPAFAGVTLSILLLASFLILCMGTTHGGGAGDGSAATNGGKNESVPGKALQGPTTARIKKRAQQPTAAGKNEYRQRQQP